MQPNTVTFNTVLLLLLLLLLTVISNQKTTTVHRFLWANELVLLAVI